MRNDFIEDFPSSKFLVYIHPFSTERAVAIRCFEKMKIPYFVSRIQTQTEAMIIPDDGHPTSFANRLIAEELSKVVEAR
jgi:hypothetical protein